MKILVINNESLFYDYYKRRGLGAAIYKELHNTLLKAIRRIHIKFNLPFKSIWFSKEFKNINYEKEDRIIIFD